MKSSETAADAANLITPTVAASRVPPLQGGRNFRDLGGYATGDGRRVRWGRLYRSGSMAGLTPVDCDYLDSLGIRWICDLRTTDERLSAPSSWQQPAAPRYWSRDHATSFGDLRTLLKAGLPPTAAQVRDVMLSAYRHLPFEQAPAYRELFKRLATGELPMVFNCTAGKDRTGIVAALILDALGVPREVILEDYALTNELLDAHRFANGKQSLLGQLSPEVLHAIMGSDPDYLRCAFAVIEERHGCVETYLREVLDIGAEDLNAIRAELLE